MENKTQKAIQLFKAGERIRAYGIVRTFRMGLPGLNRKVFQQAFESHHNPGFYRQIHGEQWLESIQQAAQIKFEEVFLNQTENEA